jgi:hypothetical protein
MTTARVKSQGSDLYNQHLQGQMSTYISDLGFFRNNVIVMRFQRLEFGHLEKATRANFKHFRTQAGRLWYFSFRPGIGTQSKSALPGEATLLGV